MPDINYEDERDIPNDVISPRRRAEKQKGDKKGQKGQREGDVSNNTQR